MPGGASLPPSLVADLIQLTALVHLPPSAHAAAGALDDWGTPARAAAVAASWEEGPAAAPVPVAAGGRRFYHDAVGEAVAALLAAPDEPPLLLTGHSLGGAIAHVVGARWQVPSVGWHSPGVMLPRRKFGLTSGRINQWTTRRVAVDPPPRPHRGGRGRRWCGRCRGCLARTR